MQRHSWKLSLLVVALIVTGSTLLFAKNQPDDINQLLVQGHFWYARGHNNLAINAWRKVLRAEPKNKEALAGLEEISEFDPEAIDREQLKIARKLAAEKKYEEALAAYKLAFNGKPPTSFHAAEYFETLSGKKARYKDAHLGLKKLVERYPSNIEYRIVLARVESYQEEHRRSAIKHFEMLSELQIQEEKFQARLQSSWHDALLWLNADKKDIPEYERFIKIYPESADIEQRLFKLNTPVRNTDAGAFALLEQGKLKAAAAGFHSVLRQHPESADSMEGLGIVRLKQQRYSEAASWLEKAIKADPKKSGALSKPLDDANFWNGFHRAIKAVRKKQYHKAQQLSDSLLLKRPEQKELVLLRAQIAADQEDYSVARDYYQQVIKLQPGSKAAKAGIIDTLIKQKIKTNIDTEDGEKLLQQHKLSKAEFLAAKNRIDASTMRAQAATEKSPDKALEILSKAMSLDPQNAWIRFDIAEIYARMNVASKGEKILRELLTRQPQNPEAAYAMALFQKAYGTPHKALAALKSIPQAARNEDQQKLLASLETDIQLTKAKQYIAEGKTDSAQVIATELENKIGGHLIQKINYAELLLALGNKNEALNIANKAMTSAPLSASIDADMYLRYAALLLKSDSRSELEVVFAKLNLLTSEKLSLSKKQQAELNQLKLGSATQTAARLLARDQADEAEKVLSPFVNEHHQNYDLQLLLGSIYQQQKKYPQSLATYRNVLAEEPNNIAAISGAYGSAMTLQEYSLAESITDSALETQPDQPRLLAQRAKLEMLQQKHHSAERNLTKALSLSGSDEKNAGWHKQAEKDLTQLQDRSSTTLTAALAIRNRGNDDGLDVLEELAVPVEYRRRLSDGQQLRIGLRFLDLDASRLSSADANRYGSLVLAPNPDLNLSTSSADGVAPHFELLTDQWAVDLGTTASSFLADNIVAGIKWRFQSYKHALEASLSRRAVKESLLSYAGAFDPLSGKGWGGVTRNGVGLKYSSHYDKGDIYSQAGVFQLSGENVKNNAELSLSGGLSWPVFIKDGQQGSIGLHASYRDFEHNLGFYTLGHGGYFSPQNYLSLTVPFEFRKQIGRFGYRVNLSAGLQRFDEAAVLVFPDDPKFQNQLETLAAGNPNLTTRHAAAENSSGVYTLGGEVLYSLDKRTVAGGWISLNNSDNFDEVTTGVFLRYRFKPVSKRQILNTINFENSEVW